MACPERKNDIKWYLNKQAYSGKSSNKGLLLKYLFSNHPKILLKESYRRRDRPYLHYLSNVFSDRNSLDKIDCRFLFDLEVTSVMVILTDGITFPINFFSAETARKG